MNVRGMRNAAAFGAEPDIKAWADRVALNPSRVAPEDAGAPGVSEVQGRLEALVPAGLKRLAELGGQAPA